MVLDIKKVPFCNRWGMSLIELVVVVAIIGIIAAIGAPEYSRFIARNRVRMAANDLIQEMRLARTFAIKENREYLIVFDLNGTCANTGTACTSGATCNAGEACSGQSYMIGFDGGGVAGLSLADATDGYGNGPVRVVNLFDDYGASVEFRTLSTNDSGGGATLACNNRAVCFGTANATSETFEASGAVGDMGRVFLQHVGRGFSYEVEVQNLSGLISLWRWDGDDGGGITEVTWTEVR